jgi:hypothetical protein
VRYDDGIDGPARVWLAHADIPGLAMSRSLGDKVAHSAGVSSEPEIFELQLVEGEHAFLVSIVTLGSAALACCRKPFVGLQL